MKNTKRILTVGFILAMLISLAACSPDKTEDNGMGAPENQDIEQGIPEADGMGIDGNNLDAPETDAIGVGENEVNATETQDLNVDTADTEMSTDVEASVDTEVVRREFGDIVMPTTIEEIPAAYEEVSKSFIAEITPDEEDNAFELFTLAVSSELANDSVTATAAWGLFDELNIIQG